MAMICLALGFICSLEMRFFCLYKGNWWFSVEKCGKTEKRKQISAFSFLTTMVFVQPRVKPGEWLGSGLKKGKEVVFSGGGHFIIEGVYTCQQIRELK